MADEKKTMSDTQVDPEELPTEEPLPHCTTAASAEQARASDEDEPCDDARRGKKD